MDIWKIILKVLALLWILGLEGNEFKHNGLRISATFFLTGPFQKQVYIIIITIGQTDRPFPTQAAFSNSSWSWAVQGILGGVALPGCLGFVLQSFNSHAWNNFKEKCSGVILCLSMWKSNSSASFSLYQLNLQSSFIIKESTNQSCHWKVKFVLPTCSDLWCGQQNAQMSFMNNGRTILIKEQKLSYRR